MGSPTSAEIAVTLQMIGRPLRSCWRKASAPDMSRSIARRKTLRGLLRVSIDHMQAKVSSSSDSNSLITGGETFDRRKVLLASFIWLSIDAFQNALINSMAIAAEFADMPALRGKDYGKTKMRYLDYTETQSGLQYKDLREGDGPKPKMGEIVVRQTAAPLCPLASRVSRDSRLPTETPATTLAKFLPEGQRSLPTVPSFYCLSAEATNNKFLPFLSLVGNPPSKHNRGSLALFLPC